MATIQEAITALQKGARAFWMPEDKEVVLQDWQGYGRNLQWKADACPVYVAEDNIFCGWRIEWPEPETPDYIYPGAAVKLRDGRKAVLDNPYKKGYGDPVTGRICEAGGIICSWRPDGRYMRREESRRDIVGPWVEDEHSVDGYYDVPVEEDSELDYPMMIVKIDGIPFSINGVITSRPDFAGYMYEGEEYPRSEFIMWRYYKDGVAKGVLQYKSGPGHVPMRPVAVRMKSN